jgi:spermidine/putrescine transport system permease protein
MTGPGINNISTYVYATTKRINPSVNALSTLIVLAIALILVLSNVLPLIKTRRMKNDEETA